ncbi:MAG: hypothetical protein VX970_05550 [Planctomycetota bacterium]|nr:hypothetical protein [Planctomycetota bacterium]
MDERRILKMTIPTSQHIDAEHLGHQTTLLEEYDPYIAGLIRNLQREVRAEKKRNHSRIVTHSA